jgi:elongation factor 1-beta
MGEVAVLFRLMPTSVEVDMRAIAEKVPSVAPVGVRIRGMQSKDIAYGIKALLVSAVMADAGGLLSATEEALAKVPGVESVEVMEEGLL